MKNNVDLINGPIDSTLRKFAAPLTISFLIHMVYAWVDMFYVSLVSPYAMGSVGVSEQIIFLAFGIGIGFGVGTGIVVARRIGEGNIQKANNTATIGIISMFIFAWIISSFLYISYPWILDIMKISGQTYSMAHNYLSIVIFGLPFNFIIFQVNSTVRSTGNSFFPMLLLIFTNIVNAIVSPVLIFGLGPIPAMGIYGAGLGTAFAQFIGACIAIISLMNNVTNIKFDIKNIDWDWSIVSRIVKLGVPASLQLITVSVNRMVLSSFTYIFGASVLTSYMLGLRVDLLVFMSIFAVGAAVEITTGQNLGAVKRDRVFAYFRSAVKQLSVLMLILGTIVFFTGDYLAMIFTKDKEIIDMVSLYLKINAFSYAFFAVGIISIRVISGAGAYFRSLLIVILVLFVIQVPLCYFLANFTSLEYEGIWYGILFSQVSFAFIGYYMLSRKKWLGIEV